MATIGLGILQLASMLLIARALLSWFPVSPTSRWASAASFLRRVTEPVLAPVRRVLPRTGRVDFSPLVVLLVIGLVLTPLARGL